MVRKKHWICHPVEGGLRSSAARPCPPQECFTRVVTRRISKNIWGAETFPQRRSRFFPRALLPLELHKLQHAGRRQRRLSRPVVMGLQRLPSQHVLGMRLVRAICKPDADAVESDCRLCELLRFLSGINHWTRASNLLPDRFEKEIRELPDGFERLLAIERVRTPVIRIHPGRPQTQAKEEDR
jgi:hypothetical protein